MSKASTVHWAGKPLWGKTREDFYMVHTSLGKTNKMDNEAFFMHISFHKVE